MLGHPFPEVLNNPLPERSFPGHVRCRGSGEGRDEPHQTLPHDFRWQPTDVHLERILCISLVRINERAPGVALESPGQELFDQGLDLWLAKMEEMARIIEGKPVLLIRPTEAADFLFALIQVIRNT